MNATLKPRPRTKLPETRRDELMNAAETLFLEKGLGPTRIEEITQRAGVAKGTFYLHFPSKEEVHAALGLRFEQQYVDKLAQAIATLPPRAWKPRLAAWVTAAVTGFLEHGLLVNMLYHAYPRPADGRPSPIVAHLSDLLEAGAADGAWQIPDANLTALFLFGALHGVIDDALLNERPIDHAPLVEHLRQLAFRTVGAPDA
jgi:AcrR family transcriptional regulator